MNKYIKVGLIVVGILICFILTDKLVLNQTSLENGKKKHEIISEKIDSDLLKTKIDENYNLYYYKLNNVIYIDNNEEVELKDALASGKITIDDIVSKLEKKQTIFDGGTTIYKNADFFKEDIELIKCNTKEGNRDVYVGLSGMGYRNNFCKDENQTLTKVFEVKSFEKTNDRNRIKVLLSDEVNEEYVTLYNIYGAITSNGFYEFKCMYDPEKLVSYDIKSIFNNCTLIEINNITY